MSFLRKLFGGIKKDYNVDFDDLTRLIEAGVEATILDIRNTYPDEHFYAYVLSTYSDKSSVSLHANSYENLERVYKASGIETHPAKIQARFEELEKTFGDDPKTKAKMRQTKATELAYYKWFWGEWLEFEFIGEQSVLETTWTWLDENEKAFSGSDEADYFDIKWEKVPLCMIEAMKNSDTKGLFGVGKARDNVLLFTGEYGSGEEEDMLLSMKALNPKASYEKYENDVHLFLEV